MDRTRRCGERIVLGAGAKKRIAFLLSDKTTGLERHKDDWSGRDSYGVDLEITIKRGDQMFRRQD